MHLQVEFKQAVQISGVGDLVIVGATEAPKTGNTSVTFMLINFGRSPLERCFVNGLKPGSLLYRIFIEDGGATIDSIPYGQQFLIFTREAKCYLRYPHKYLRATAAKIKKELQELERGTENDEPEAVDTFDAKAYEEEFGISRQEADSRPFNAFSTDNPQSDRMQILCEQGGDDEEDQHDDE